MHQRYATNLDQRVKRTQKNSKRQRAMVNGDNIKMKKRPTRHELKLILRFSMVVVIVLALTAILLRKSSTTEEFQVFSSKAPLCLPLSNLPTFTMVTQLSQDRLWMMEHHCERFPHPISIAVWTNESLREIEDQLISLKCSLDMVRVQVLDASDMAFDDYPVNHLRNLALQQVETTHIVFIDVDFWSSEGLYDILTNKTVTSALVENKDIALVIPAFQLFRQCTLWVDCRERNVPSMPFSLDELLDMRRNKRGHIFDPTNKGGHGSTLYEEWLLQEEGTLLEIPCLKSNRYEPFIVVRYCRDLPPFQEAFSGYGKNKMSWMMQLVRSGYTLSQLGGAFLVHYPHLDSQSRQRWNEAPDQLKVFRGDDREHFFPLVRKPNATDNGLDLKAFKRGQVDEIFVRFRKWLQEQVPDNSKLKVCDDHEDDDSKLWVDRAE
ncbi:unnamed protein product [Cylindrotheca closterium]|uniref:Uncharacterized protein n=1 Tax=Cylindrotheca closterium TaxID=2856 RepID=A0AAD2PW43_9STRA|nr:unnamed protein product [Cylindrotheca closterium]